MQRIVDETVGEGFKVDLLQLARDRSLQVILEAARQMRPGSTEKDAKALIHDIQTKLGAPKSWHPPQIRFGVNTLRGFGEPGQDGVVLGENDIFFFDLGPIFEGHEGDIGRPFVVGHDPEMIRCRADVEKIWLEVRDHWQQTQVAGRELYRFAQERAETRGWQLILKEASGHRISDFPHAARMRGSIEEFEATPATDRWILEIQIRHPVREFGAFYEDLLTER